MYMHIRMRMHVHVHTRMCCVCLHVHVHVRLTALHAHVHLHATVECNRRVQPPHVSAASYPPRIITAHCRQRYSSRELAHAAAACSAAGEMAALEALLCSAPSTCRHPISLAALRACTSAGSVHAVLAVVDGVTPLLDDEAVKEVGAVDVAWAMPGASHSKLLSPDDAADGLGEASALSALNGGAVGRRAEVFGAAVAMLAANGAWTELSEMLVDAGGAALVSGGAAVAAGSLSGRWLQRAVILCARAQEWGRLLEIVRQPCVLGTDGQPMVWSVPTYHAALKGCRLRGEWRIALQLLRELQALAAHPPDDDDAHDADASSAEAHERGVGQPPAELGRPHAVDAGCFAAVMTACLRAHGDPAALLAVHDLLEEATRAGQASGAVYGAAMHAYVLAGSPADAWALLQRAVKAQTELITLELNIGLGAAAR